MTEADDVHSGISRRQALRRGAIAGGAVLWATPVVQTIAVRQAGAQAASPPGEIDGKAISNIQFCFTCGGTTYFAHVDSIHSANNFNCDDNIGEGAECFDQDTLCAGAQDGCGLFTLSNLVFDNEGELAGVTVTLTCAGGVFVHAAAKCGQLCSAAQVGSNQTTFTACA